MIPELGFLGKMTQTELFIHFLMNGTAYLSVLTNYWTL